MIDGITFMVCGPRQNKQRLQHLLDKAYNKEFRVVQDGDMHSIMGHKVKAVMLLSRPKNEMDHEFIQQLRMQMLRHRGEEVLIDLVW